MPNIGQSPMVLFMDKTKITDAQINELRTEALQKGDNHLAIACNVALGMTKTSQARRVAARARVAIVIDSRIATASRISTKEIRPFGATVVHIDGKPLTIAGQGWSQWASVEADSVVYHSTNPSGNHSITLSVSSPERILAHWAGFIADQKNPQAWS